MDWFWIQTVLFFLTVLSIAAGCIIVGYTAYAARRYGERAAEARQRAGPDPVVQLGQIHDEIAALLVAANRTLEKTRTTVRKSMKG